MGKANAAVDVGDVEGAPEAELVDAAEEVVGLVVDAGEDAQLLRPGPVHVARPGARVEAGLGPQLLLQGRPQQGWTSSGVGEGRGKGP